MIMTMVPVYLHVFINNSYICIVMRTCEAHSIIFSVMIVIIVIMIIILIIGIKSKKGSSCEAETYILGILRTSTSAPPLYM